MYAQYLTVALKLYGCRWCSAGSSKQPRWECLDRRILLAMDSAHVFIPQKMSRCMPPFPQKSWEIFPVTSYSAEGSKRLHVPKLFSRFSQFSRYACFLQVHWGLCEGLKTKDTPISLPSLNSQSFGHLVYVCKTMASMARTSHSS